MDLVPFPTTETTATFAAFLETLFHTRFTGTITLHFRGGMPHRADFGSPIRVEFDRTPLDKTERSAASS